MSEVIPCPTCNTPLVYHSTPLVWMWCNNCNKMVLSEFGARILQGKKCKGVD